MSRSQLSVAALSVLVGVACAGKAAPSDAEDAQSRRTGGDATVINATILESSGTSILNVLPSYVAGLRVRHTDGGCPEIRLRGTGSLYNSSDPVIYVDGTRTGNTCVLDTLVPTEVNRIEVYPMGVTTRPGYRNHPHGLILVFMKTSD